jgi:hypothetical protein
MVKKINNKNSSVGDNMVSAETSGNAGDIIDNVIDEVVGGKRGRGRPSKADGTASRANSVVLPPENTNNKGSRSLSAPGGVKAKATKSVSAIKIKEATLIPKETARRNETVVESNESESEEVNDEQRRLERQILAQRRALLEYELKKVEAQSKKVKAQLDELQEPMVTATTPLMTNDIDSDSDLEQIPNEQRYITPGATGKGKKILFNLTASNNEGKLSHNERDEDDLRQFERPTPYFKSLASVRRPLYSRKNYGLPSACNNMLQREDVERFNDNGEFGYNNKESDDEHARMNNKFQNAYYSKNPRMTNNYDVQTEEPCSQRILSNYRMKCPRFSGVEEDYDAWYGDMLAYFRLNSFTEKEKINIMLAQLGGEARSFISGYEDTQFQTVAKLHNVLKETFSEQINKAETLMACKQKVGEKIRSYGLRLSVLASKCGYKGEESNEWCMAIIRQNALPYFTKLLKYCMPDITLVQAIKYLILNEPSQVNFTKRTYEIIDKIDEDDSSEDDSNISIKRSNSSNKSGDDTSVRTKQQLN